MHTTGTATVFLVDDHPIVRLGYRMLLNSDARLRILDEAETGVDAMSKIVSTRPDLAIIDLSLPDVSGLDVTRHLQRECPEVKILIVSAHRTRAGARQALAAGADGYIIKDKAESLIRDAIDVILKGRLFVCDEIRRKLGDELDRVTLR